MEHVETMENLKQNVVNNLVTKHDFLLDDAETAVEASASSRPDMWSENADAEDLTNFLASDEDDE